MIRKILCFLGFHSFENKLYFLYTKGIKSVYRLDATCKYCGKRKSELLNFPKI